MSNTQEQSLDENVVFLPVTESCPEFLHCERERQAVERLLNAGPEAFYSAIGTERSGCFLSPEEVSQITSWAQDYRFTPRLVVHREENEAEDSSVVEDFHSTYFPSYSDMPTPDLELGWPERSPWMSKGSVTVHTNPPADGEPPVREIIRRNLQKASLVIAIVTDRLTDGVVIGDLHNAASRGVPVYIILNQRSIQENFTLNRLRHPNMQVRVLGGKTFCSRTGRMVVGEMKDKFILVDLETVIHGSYSLTWTDAHLHRQLITVLHGPVVESFDREFRILFAASLPISDTWRVGGSNVDMVHQLKDLSGLRFQKHLPLEPEFGSPPSPPADSLLDWEAMGVLQRDCISPNNPHGQHEEIFLEEGPLQNNNVVFSKNTPLMDGFVNGNRFVERIVERRQTIEHTSPVINNMPERSTTFNNKSHSPTDLPSPEDVKCVDRIIEKTLARQLSIEKNTSLQERRAKRLVLKVEEPTNDVMMLSSVRRRERPQRELIPEGDSGSDRSSPTVENKPLSRKPIILRMPQSESFNSLNDLMMRLQPLQSPSSQLSRGSKGAGSELSRSMMELSAPNTDRSPDGTVPVPRLRTTGYDPGEVSSALTLMKKRNDDLKPSLYRSPKVFVPRERPRSTALTLDWRRSLAELDGEQK